MEVGAYARSERQSLKPLLGEVAILCIHAPGANDLLRTCKAELSYPYPYMTIHERNAVIQPCHFLRQDDLDTPASKTKLRGNVLVLEYCTWSNITKRLSSDEECDE